MRLAERHSNPSCRVFAAPPLNEKGVTVRLRRMHTKCQKTGILALYGQRSKCADLFRRIRDFHSRTIRNGEMSESKGI